jgi:activator of 2-hydroxyglutaryl-CoA dehydratase/predicted nucleotide-binding protein (sugar kinase/HSP70/actin superfamily)
MSRLYIGLDIGSSYVHSVVLNKDRDILHSAKSIQHFANPLGAIKEAWQDITAKFPADQICSTAFTGSGAKTFTQVMENMTYVYESVAIPKGVAICHPQAEYVFHIGAKDSYFFHLSQVNEKPIIQEWRTGTKCGGGSGTLIEKQCRRLFQGEVPHAKLTDTGSTSDPAAKEKIRIENRGKLQERMEQMYSLAETEAALSKEPSEFLARCGVVVQSDLIHKQNEGASRVDNLAGLFKTVARNYKIDVLGARKFVDSDSPYRAVATGGVMANDLIRGYLSDFVGIRIDPADCFMSMAAIGAAAEAIERDNRFVFDFNLLAKATEQSRESRQFNPALKESLSLVHEQTINLDSDIPAGVEVVIGIDGGSTTTKGALVELETGRLLDKLYIKTHGNPEGSLKDVLRYLSRHGDNVIVRGVGATGSARKLYEKILVSQEKALSLADQGVAIVDRITDEITCHAMGVKHNNPDTDTIFEIGGQDMKFTRFAADGTVKEAKMNYSCQAGSGQTLENMADIIDLQVEDSLQEAALRAPRVPIIDATCGVFMEMDENRLIAEGFSRDEIAAAIVQGTAASYYYKFVGGAQHVGKVCSAQGGPPLGKAFLAALAQVTEREIEAYPHREMFGAWGQALDIIDGIKKCEKEGIKWGSAFRGWSVIDMPFQKSITSCKAMLGDKSCGIRDCQLECFSIENDEIVTGGFCPKGNSEAVTKPQINYVDKYHRIYEKHFKEQGGLFKEITEAFRQAHPDLKTIGIKRSTATLGEKGIWSAALLKALGFYPVVSPRSDGQIAKFGLDNSRTEFCIARKLATGHAHILNEHPLIDYLFNPSFIEQRTDSGLDLKYCIYTESEGYVLNDVLSLDKTQQLNPVLHFGDMPLLINQLREELARVGLRFSARELRRAITGADAAEKAFTEELHAEGDKFLERIAKDDTKAYVGIGRDYVLLDPEASSNSGHMFSHVRGLNYIPQLFLEHKFKDISLDEVVENEFWVQSVKILKANFYVADHPNLFAIRLINFACGPDAVKIYQERKIHQVVNKPMLVLVTDGQTNNAPFVTRTEAHERVVDQSKADRFDITKLIRTPHNHHADRTWLVPFMGNVSVVGAAILRGFGVDARSIPTHTPLGQEMARKHISTEVCHPLKGVAGDILAFLTEETKDRGADFVKDKYLIMMPTTSGPCRLGKYAEVVREFLDNEDMSEIPVVGPSSKSDYIDMPFPEDVGLSGKMAFQRVLFRAVKACDLLEDTFLRFRPYAADKAQVDQLRRDCLSSLEKVLEEGGEIPALVEWGHETVSCFQGCETFTDERFPLVLYVGEIYMRQHDPSTGNVIHRLEDTGLELVRDPVTEWLHYINRINRRKSKRDIQLGVRYADLRKTLLQMKKYGQSLVKGLYMSKVEERIEEPFHDVLKGRHVLPKPMEMIETLEKAHEIHGHIEGESPVNTGIAYHVMHDLTESHDKAPICGIFHVGPFTCMQESVATAKIEAMVKEFRKKDPNLIFPIIHAFFGDSPNANLDAEIAVFREQCYQKHEMQVSC